jgi:ADP-ribose pyrophosphatase YjhB (NUDIX family)
VATPDFILELRKMVGPHPLWLSGVTAVILDASGENVLLIRRADTGEWTPVTGIIDPGEQPAVAAAREALEEADVVIDVVRLAGIGVTSPVVYENGDRAQYLDVVFTCRWVSGDPRPADGEALEARWFAIDGLPAISAEMRNRIDQGRESGPAAFSIAATPAAW